MTHTHITVLWYLNWVESTDMISQGLPWDFWTVPLAAHHRSQSVGWDERAHPRNAPGYCHQNTQRLGHEIDGTITMHVYKYIVICHMYIHAHKIKIYIYIYSYIYICGKMVHTIYKQTINSSNTKPFTQHWPEISEGLDCGIAISDGQTRQLLKPCPLTHDTWNQAKAKKAKFDHMTIWAWCPHSSDAAT